MLKTSDRSSTFGEALVRAGLLSGHELAGAASMAEKSQLGLVAALYQSGLLAGEVLASALSTHYDLERAEAVDFANAGALASRFSASFMRARHFHPLHEGKAVLTIAISDPGDVELIRDLQIASQRRIALKVATVEEIEKLLSHPSSMAQEALKPEAADIDIGSEADFENLRDMALGTPVVRLVNEMLQAAIQRRATDLHVEPFDGKLVLRIRVDGVLMQLPSPPPRLARAVVSRLKILSDLDIAERRLPQDGRARLRLDNRQFDLRVATMPTIHGEAVAVRLLDNVRRQLDLDRLGFGARDKALFSRHLQAPHGLIIVTGPTGSGKTTTLATALSHLNNGQRKILTVEDPIEYELDGVNQTQVKPAIGLDFASALRSFLRHDPDVIMVGEMRDSETARIGIHAALTGHLVLTTLHTNSASAAVVRLLDMGVDAFLLASCLRCVIGQRLVRVLCPHCREFDPQTDAAVALARAAGVAAPAGPFYRAVGCDRCYSSGFVDRVAVAEVLDVDEPLRDLIRPGMAASAIESQARDAGMTSMLADGLTKCAAGITSIDEIRRVASGL